MSTKIAIFTEAEAREQLCWKKLGHAWEFERGHDGLVDTRRCEAGRCMAWRWFATHVPVPAGPPMAVANAEGQTSVVQRGASTELVGDRYGYCGLAGDPMGWSSP